MIVEPKIRGFICTTAHPVGCYAKVKEQIEYVTSHFEKKVYSNDCPKRVLIIGASTGYGLASRIVSAFAYGAKTLGISYEKAADEKRTASAGWYNTAALEKELRARGYYARSLNGDAFSKTMKEDAAMWIRKELGQVDLIIYSLASPRRIHPETQAVFQSVLKPIGETFYGKSVDVFREELKDVMIEPATEEEIQATISVMGGEDWELWIRFLAEEKLLADGIKTVAYSYVGPELTHAIYKNGTIGRAKSDLLRASREINSVLHSIQGKAYVSVNKALVTQASAAIPVVPLYISILYKIMKARGVHEGCIEQISRLFSDYLYSDRPLQLDAENMIRLDDREMDSVIQAEVISVWNRLNQNNLHELTDLSGYQRDFYQLFGFAMQNVNYQADVETIQSIPSLEQ